WSTSRGVAAETVVTSPLSRGARARRVSPSSSGSPSTQALPSACRAEARECQSGGSVTPAEPPDSDIFGSDPDSAGPQRGHGIAVDDRAQPRPVRYDDRAVGGEGDRFGQQEVTTLDRPARWVERELEEGATADTGGHVQIRQKAEPVAPGVGCEPAVAGHDDL